MNTLIVYACAICGRRHAERPNRNPGHFCKNRAGKWFELTPQPEGDTAA